VPVTLPAPASAPKAAEILNSRGPRPRANCGRPPLAGYGVLAVAAIIQGDDFDSNPAAYDVTPAVAEPRTQAAAAVPAQMTQGRSGNRAALFAFMGSANSVRPQPIPTSLVRLRSPSTPREEQSKPRLLSCRNDSRPGGGTSCGASSGPGL
jgi:hypothetical protein